MNFQHRLYWQEKAKNLAIETRLFINGEYCAAVDNTTLKPLTLPRSSTLASMSLAAKPTLSWRVKARASGL